MTGGEDLILIGRVVKPHGIRGELVVEPEGGTLASVQADDVLWLGASSCVVVGVRPHQGRTLLTVDSCADRTAAESLRGAQVSIASGQVTPPGDGEWFTGELPGWSVTAPGGEVLGVVRCVVPGPAHDYLELDGGGALVPMVRAWLRGIDPEQRSVVMELPPGLLDPSD